MARITIVIEDQPAGRGGRVVAQTDAAAPGIGQQYTPAQGVANTLLRALALQVSDVQYGNASASLAGELLNCQQE